MGWHIYSKMKMLQKKYSLKQVLFTKEIIAYMQPQVEVLWQLFLISCSYICSPPHVPMGLSCCDHD